MTDTPWLCRPTRSTAVASRARPDPPWSAEVHGCRTFVAAGVPAVVLGSPTSAAASGVGTPVDGLAVHDAGHILASLRFGMFVHFNPSSVVGREISWGRNAYRPGEGAGNQYKDPSVKTDPACDAAYREFPPAEDWAPKLAATARAAGMNYLVFTTKHHDGYPSFRADNVTRSFYADYAQTPGPNPTISRAITPPTTST